MRIRGLVTIALVMGCGHSDPPPQPPVTHATPPVTPVLAELPAQCVDYLAALDKLSACKTLPESNRDAFRKTKEQAASSLPRRLEAPLQRQQAIDECTSGRDGLVKSLPACDGSATAAKIGSDARCEGTKMPRECTEYCYAIASLAKCGQLPQSSKDALWESYEELARTLKDMPAETQAAAAEGCVQARDAVMQAVASCK